MLRPANIATAHRSNLSIRPRLASHPLHHVVAIGGVIYHHAPPTFRLKSTSSVINGYHIAPRSKVFTIGSSPGFVIGSPNQQSWEPFVDRISIPAGQI